MGETNKKKCLTLNKNIYIHLVEHIRDGAPKSEKKKVHGDELMRKNATLNKKELNEITSH